MFHFFSKRKRKEEKVNSLLITKLDRIIELLEKQQNAETSGKNIHLEHVQIDHLENIIFRLDNIEIDELSGKLLIGTNISGTEDFAASIIQKVDKQGLKQEAMKEETDVSEENQEEPLADHSKMMKTPKGYRFRSRL
jgi:hypothetical protein